ncbi:MAG: hypothetical protein HY918_01715 [Candidatus Doudnabacteria bacterium]|nr:hypothetical protein [Candidatus Doudnabacteria bacterium]
MNKKYIIILILVLVVLFGGLFVLQKGILKKTYTEKKLSDKNRNLTDQQKRVYQDNIKKAEDYLKSLQTNNKAGLHQSIDETYIYLGQEYYGLGELEMSKQMYERALAQSPKAEQAMVGLVIVYQEAGDKSAALAAIEPAILNKTKTADIWLRYIQMRIEEGAAAVNINSIYNDALNATDRSVDILSSFAQYQEQNGNLKDSLALWQEALKKDPKNSSFENEIAKLKNNK